jgi:sn-glycerol 3-phosphate transport system permease protein
VSAASSAQSGLPKPIRQLITALPFIGPSIILFGTFVFYPLGKSVYLTFYKSNPFGTRRIYVGLENYRDVLTSGDFRTTLLITGTFALYTVVPSLIIATFLATLANQRLPGVVIFRTIFSSTIAASVAIASVFFLVLIHPSIGVLNDVLGKFGIGPKNWLQDGGWAVHQHSGVAVVTSWFTDPNWALISISMVTVWMNIGLFTMILLAGLQTIPEELYESSRIDGAGPWSQFWHVTLPMLSPSLFFAAVVGLLFSFQAFGQISLLTGGGPAGSTNTLLYSIYQEGFQNLRRGAASVEALALFAIMVGLTLMLFRLVASRVYYGGDQR